MDTNATFKKWQWKVLLLSVTLYLFVYLGRLNWGLSAHQIIEQLHWKKEMIGVGAACLFWGYAVGQATHGRLCDRFGGRHWALVGVIGTTAVNECVALSSNPKTIFALLAVNGFFQAMIFPSLLRLTAQWWPSRKRGLQTGLLMTSAGAASVVAFGLSGWVIASFGWRASFEYPVILIVIVGVIFWTFVRERPEDVGLAPYIETRADVAKHEAIEEKHFSAFGPYLYLLRQKVFLAACAMGFLMSIGRYGLLTWIPLYYAQTSGLAIKSSIWAQIGLPIGTAFGPLFAGIISDKLFGSSRWQTLAISFLGAATGLLVLSMTSLQTLGLGTAFAVLIVSGFFVYGAGGSMGALVGDLGGRRMHGTAHGLLDACNYVGAGLQGIIIGGILDRTSNNWTITFGLLGISLLIGCLIAIYTGKMIRNTTGKAFLPETTA